MENKINKNVGLWLALNKDNKIITIDKATNGVDYYCAECGSIVHSRALNSECISPHFYHLNKSDCGCEDAIHRYWKENLINIDDTINLPYIGEITCIDKRIEFTFNTEEGIYKPDLVIKTNNPKYRFIILEMFNTNKKDISYLQKWQNLKYNVFEINVKQLNYNKNNIYDCVNLLYSPQIDSMQNNIIKYINDKFKEYYSNLHKERINDEAEENIINGLSSHQRELLNLGFMSVDDFTRIKYGKYPQYKYKNIKINNFQVNALKKIEENLKIILDDFLPTKETLHTIRMLDNSIFDTKWSKQLYFEIIKPIHNKLIEFIKNMDFYNTYNK